MSRVQPTSAPLARFGPFEFDRQTLELRKQGRFVRLQEQPARILTALLDTPGRLVTRDELRALLWPADTFVDFDNGLNTAINKLRSALGDRAGNPRYIETVGRKGYRLIAPLEPYEASLDPAIASNPPARGMESAKRFRLPSFVGLTVGFVCIISVAGVLFRNWFGRADNLPSGERSRLITALQGVEANPTLSPDGTMVAFIWRGALYVKPVDASEQTRIAEPAEEAAWSPDGQSIAFLRPNRTTARPALVLISPLGSDERVVVPDLPLRSAGISWSPNGDRIALTGILEAGKPAAVLFLSPSTGEVRRFSDPPGTTMGDRAPTFSPDGQTVAFLRVHSQQGHTEILLQPLGGAEPKKAGVLKGMAFDLEWLPREPALLASFHSNESLQGLWRVPLDGGAMTALATSENARGFSLARLTDRLVYSSHRLDCELWETYPGQGVEGVRSRRLPVASRADWAVQASPDGKRIAFASIQKRVNQIWVCDRNGTNCRQLTQCSSQCNLPRWSPDSLRIAYVNESPNMDVYVVDLSGTVSQLTKHPEMDAAPSWSRDGEWVFFLSTRSGQSEIWRVPSRGGTEIRVTADGTNGRETSDGQWFVYMRPTDRTLRRMRLNGDADQEIARFRRGLATNWVLLSDAIVYTEPPADGGQFIRLELATGRATDILHLPSGTSRCVGFDVAPDGAILYSRATSEADLVLLEK